MKLHHKNIEKDSHGSITMTPEEPEDMWHVYNLIAVDDTVRASTIRKVTTESATGSTTSNRVRTILTIRVEDIDFDNQACKVNHNNIKNLSSCIINSSPNNAFTVSMTYHHDFSYVLKEEI